MRLLHDHIVQPLPLLFKALTVTLATVLVNQWHANKSRIMVLVLYGMFFCYTRLYYANENLYALLYIIGLLREYLPIAHC